MAGGENDGSITGNIHGLQLFSFVCGLRIVLVVKADDPFRYPLFKVNHPQAGYVIDRKLFDRDMAARAAGAGNYESHFIRAAALDPVQELSSDKYSPETVAVYSRLKGDLLRKSMVPIFIEGTPLDASVSIGGLELKDISTDKGHMIRPGAHFLDISAPGYEPWSLILDTRDFETSSVRFELIPSGPEGDPDDFFLQRFKAGDRPYLTILAGKLKVDYLLIPDPGEDVLFRNEGPGLAVALPLEEFAEAKKQAADGVVAPGAGV